MKIFDFFKKKKPFFAKATKGKKEEKQEKKEPSFAPASAKASADKSEDKKKEKELPLIKKNLSGREVFILKHPHVTEKATNLAEKNQYIFKVFPGASKKEIGNAVEGVYGVRVLGVRTIKIPGKPKRLGRNIGWKGGYKKAIVILEKGQKIEIMPK